VHATQAIRGRRIDAAIGVANPRIAVVAAALLAVLSGVIVADQIVAARQTSRRAPVRTA
jgi:hypothetical protein